MTGVRQRLAFLAGLLTGSKALTGPWFVAIDVTNRCNLQCLGCLAHSPLLRKDDGTTHPRDFPLELYRKICGQLRGEPHCEIILIGEGEPLLHPDLVEMVREAGRNGLRTRLVTNGTLLDAEMIDRLIAAGIGRIDVSLWAVTPEDAAQVYPGTGAATFARQLAGLDLLARARQRAGGTRPQLFLHQPLSRHNADNLPGLIDIARRCGCDRVSFAPLYTHGERLADHAPTEAQLGELGRLGGTLRGDPLGSGLNDILLRYRIGEKVLDRQPCYVGWHYMRIDVTGRISPCKMCSIVVGDLNAASLEEVWNGPEMRRFRRQSRSAARKDFLGGSCDCRFCCHAVSNQRIHRIMRWFGPRG